MSRHCPQAKPCYPAAHLPCLEQNFLVFLQSCQKMSTRFPPFFSPPLIHFALVVPLGGLRATQGKQQEKSILRKKTKKLHFTLQWGNKKCFCCSQGFETEQTPAGGIGHKLYFYRKLGMVLGDTQTKTPPERIWKDGAALPSPHLYLHSAAFLGGFIRGWNS